MINKLFAVVTTIVTFFNMTAFSGADAAINAVKAKVNVAGFYVSVLGRLPSLTETFTYSNGKELAYDVLHSDEFTNKNLTEGEIVDLYYDIFLDREATDWDREFWSQRITKDDTTILLYGIINSETYTEKCQKWGLDANDYFIENEVFTEGFSAESTECGLTANGDYVFYATFGDATYYHVTYGANVA